MRYHSTTGNPQSNVARTVAVVFLAVGLVLGVAAGATNMALSQSWADRTEKVSGTVVDHRTSFRTRGSGSRQLREQLHCPVIAYAVGGTRHTLDSRLCSTSPPEIGAAVTVRYDPANPGDGAIESWQGRWLAVVILGGMGVLFVAVSGLIGLVVRATRRAPKGPPHYGPSAAHW